MTLHRKTTALTMIGIVVAAWCGPGAPAARAEEFVSQYTSADVKKCRKLGTIKIEGSPYGASWACQGPAGYQVVVSDEDLRTTVSVGRTAKAARSEPAASESFAMFNSTHDTIEWRSQKGSDKPFAMIQRWRLSDSDEKTGERKAVGLLIVTRLPPGPVCHVAYVDVAANPDANVLARQAADQYARGFTCEKDRVRIVGTRGRAIALANE
jgi:hypothetical protein